MWKKKKSNDVDALHYSRLFGRGIYSVEPELDCIPHARSDGELTPLLVSTQTGETYYLLRIPGSEENIKRFEDQIMHPARRVNICWPCDMIRMTDELRQETAVSVTHHYGDDEIDVTADEAEYGLLFLYDGQPETLSWSERVGPLTDTSHQKADAEAGWKNEALRRIAVSVVSAIRRVNRDGYLYCDFHTDRLLFLKDEPDRILLDYSSLIAPINVFPPPPPLKPAAGEYPVEYAEPAYVRNAVDHFDLQTQNFSLCAFLFRLLYRRYPYDGWFTHGLVDNDPQSHYVLFRRYYEIDPIFIFDPDNRENALGLEDGDEAYIRLWEESPKPLRDMFLRTLRTDNAMRRQKSVKTPTPDEWLNLFRTLDWVSGEELERSSS